MSPTKIARHNCGARTTTRLTGKPWAYVKVLQTAYKQLQPTDLKTYWSWSKRSFSKEASTRPSRVVASPGFRGACHRAGHYGPDPLALQGYELSRVDAAFRHLFAGVRWVMPRHIRRCWWEPGPPRRRP